MQVDTWWPSARIIAAILQCPQAGRSAAYLAATASIASTLGAGHGPFGGSPTRWRASRRQWVRSGIPASAANSRPTRHVPLSGPRGRRRDSVDELRAFLPDPQLHGRLRESELQLLALVAQPPLGLRTAHHRGRAANGPSRPCPHRRTGPASCPPSPRTPHADVLPRPATTRPSTRPTRPGSARPPTPAVTASAVCSPSHPSRLLNSTPCRKV